MSNENIKNEFEINSNNVVLCASSAYDRKYYLNPEFEGLPQAIKEELQIMCVLFTAEVGGILTLEFEEDGELVLQVHTREDDILFDEIGSGLKIRQIQNHKRELLEGLEMYYRVMILKDTSFMEE
ncbi:MAG: DUF6145 family protein [Lachnospiraceae bacterium]|nr:DUF6145 family protein [Lachnospiraceae bacterium]